MDRIVLTAASALVGGMLVFASVAEAQPRTTEPAVEVRVVTQLPVAVVRAEAAGAPAHELAELVRELRRAEAPADEVIEIIRFAPIATDARFPRRGADMGDGGVRLSELVRFHLDRGVRGRELAREIHRELRAQGIPAGRDAARRGPPPIARGYIPPEARRGMGERGEPGTRMERRGPPADLPAEAGEERRGPPADAGQRQRPTPPADAGERRGPPDEAGQRRGGPPTDAGERQRPTPPRDAGQRRGGPPSDWRSS